MDDLRLGLTIAAIILFLGVFRYLLHRWVDYRFKRPPESYDQRQRRAIGLHDSMNASCSWSPTLGHCRDLRCDWHPPKKEDPRGAHHAP